MFWQSQESQNLLREFKYGSIITILIWYFLKNYLYFNIGSINSSADLHIFIVVKYYIFAAKRLDHTLSIVEL